MFGYAGRILRVDLSSGNTTELSTSDYAARFLGGRGIGVKLYWDEVPPAADAFGPENALVFATGPLAGIPVVGGSRWQVCGKSAAPSPEHFCYCNLGGRWGAELKFAGYDAISILGKSEELVYLFIHDGVCEFKDASTLWGRGSIETGEILKDKLGSAVAVVAIGPAGENMASMANLVADNDATGGGGLGAVMGAKKVKAIVVKRTGKRTKVAQPEKLAELISYFRGLDTGPILRVGSTALRITGPQTKKEPCYGCLGNCLRRSYQAKNGERGKFMCQAANFYRSMAERYYGPGYEVPFHATKLCDDFGVETRAIQVIVSWLGRCYEAGILADENTGIPLSKPGSIEFIESLVKKISTRDGFGDILAQGVLQAADWVGPGARQLITDYVSKAGQPNVNASDPRLYITTALLYAGEPRPPLPQLTEVSKVGFKWLEWVNRSGDSYVSTDVMRAIAKRFWGGEIAADFSTLEGKALAAKIIQEREYAKECLILCSFLWPIMYLESSPDHVGDPTLESRLLSAVTGNDVDEEGLYRIGERVLNLQRAIIVREGHKGREDDVLPDSWHNTPPKGDQLNTNPECLVPGKRGEALSRKDAVIDREEFEMIKGEYYQMRHWDVVSGLQSRALLEELELKDVADDLDLKGLMGRGS